MSTDLEVNEMVLNNVTYVRKDSIKDQTAETTEVIHLDGTECAYEIGRKYMIRTVTMIQLGEVTKITGRSIVMKDACWVADTGRFSEALKTGVLKEVEMFAKPVIVSFGAIVDATEWGSELPTKTK